MRSSYLSCVNEWGIGQGCPYIFLKLPEVASPTVIYLLQFKGNKQQRGSSNDPSTPTACLFQTLCFPLNLLSSFSHMPADLPSFLPIQNIHSYRTSFSAVVTRNLFPGSSHCLYYSHQMPSTASSL